MTPFWCHLHKLKVFYIIVTLRHLHYATNLQPSMVPMLTFEKEKKATAGSDWFNLPRTEMTPELRRDLQLLKMRNVLDPKRHYKKSDSKSDVPAFSQVGTIIEGPTEFYTGRINKKDRHQTLVEEVLAQEEQSGKFKSKYQNIISSKKSGKKAFYKALQDKRRKGRVTKP